MRRALVPAGLALLLSLGMTMAACTLFAAPSIARPTVVYVPDVVGRISEMSHDGQTDTYTVMVDGQQLQIGPEVRSLRGSPGTNDSLLLYGTDDGEPWYVSIGFATIEPWAGCAFLGDAYAWDSGASIIFIFDDRIGAPGVQLAKADSWADDIPLGPDGGYPTYYSWCLDSHGRVVSARPTGGA